MNIKKARELLGEKGKKMTDEEIIDVESRLRILANMIIDKVLAMTPEERKALDKKIEKEKRSIQIVRKL